MKICMLIYSFYPFSTGASRQALMLAQKIKQKGAKVFILTHGEKNLPTQEEIKGVSVFRVVLFGNRFIRKLIYILKTILFLLKNKKKYHILHIHGGYWLNYGAIVIGKVLRKKILIKITQMGDDDPVAIKEKLFGAIQLSTFLLSDYFIVMTPAAIKTCKTAGISNSRLIHIPNGVDTQRFSPVGNYNEKLLLKERKGLGDFERIVVFVGIKGRRKGLDLLIDAWRSVLEYYSDAALLLIGPSKGESEEYNPNFVSSLEEKVCRYKIENNVFFLEEVTDIEKYLKLSDIFVFPSRAEGFPSAVIEAMSCELPCVVSRIKGVTDFIIKNKEDGLLVEQENAEEISAALKNLFDNSRLAQFFANNARGKVIENFSSEKVALDYLNAYKRMVKC